MTWPWSRIVLACSVAALVALLAFAVVRLAWISDDAYITLRVIDNVLAGHGPVWNAGERVQTFTHPAWMLLLTGACWLTGEHYFTTLVVSLLLTAATVALLLAAAGLRTAPALLLVLLASRCFPDYATSGLETPLSMLLVALLARADQHPAAGQQRLFAVAWLASLLALNRLDLVALAAPVVVAHLGGPPRRAAAVLALGLLPLVLWVAFATLYYGSPIPVTAHAKALSHGVDGLRILEQGCWYLENALRREPATVAVLVAGIALGLLRRDLQGRALALGALLYCAYVVRVGGDHMAGRFLVPPFLAALFPLLRWLRACSRPLLAPTAVAAAAVALAFASEGPAWLRPVSADLTSRFWEHGINDERRYYYDRLGLFSPNRRIPEPARLSSRLRKAGRERPLVCKAFTAGVGPYEAGELFHFVDPWLCDPLLVRLPVFALDDWNVSHYTRRIPDGYLDSLGTGENRIQHPGLRRYYECLRRVIRDPVWSGSRLAALLDFQLGRRDADRRAYIAEEYRQPPRRRIAAATLPADPGLVGTMWFDARAARVIDPAGLRIDGGTAPGARELRVLLTPLIEYRFTFLASGQPVGGRVLLAARELSGSPDDERLLEHLRSVFGLYEFTVDLPPDMPGFDAIDVDAKAPDLLVPAIGGISFR